MSYRSIVLLLFKTQSITLNNYKMEDRIPKCNCAKTGGTCGRELSLIKQGKLVADTNVENKSICPLRELLSEISLLKNKASLNNYLELTTSQNTIQ